MNPGYLFAGLLVGFLIGMTGVGSGSLLAPILLMLRIPPAAVVGTDLVCSLLTKLVGTGLHVKLGNVRWNWVGLLALGSLPGAVAGSLASSRLTQSPEQLKQWIGLMLVFAAGIAIATEIERRRPTGWTANLQSPRPWLMPLLGFGLGGIVGLTSVGSGSLIELALLLFSPLRGAEITGTGIAHGVLLSGTAALLHWKFGSVNLAVALQVTAGSIPGVWLGSMLVHRAPGQLVKFGMASLILISGLTLI